MFFLEHIFKQRNLLDTNHNNQLTFINNINLIFYNHNKKYFKHNTRLLKHFMVE